MERNNYMFRHLLMAIFRLYMKTLLWAVIQSIYVGYLYGVGRGESGYEISCLV